MTIFRYKKKFKEITSKDLENNAHSLICETCKIKNILPQHHGRDMIQEGEKLVCWRKLLDHDSLEPCEEELPLFCPNCQSKLELKIN
jgi:hypothetical protein